MSRFEYLLQKLINGETVDDWEPQSRMETHLLACINKTGIEGLGEPQSRAEELLQMLAIAIQVTGDGGIDAGKIIEALGGAY